MNGAQFIVACIFGIIGVLVCVAGFMLGILRDIEEEQRKDLEELRRRGL